MEKEHIKEIAIVTGILTVAVAAGILVAQAVMSIGTPRRHHLMIIPTGNGQMYARESFDWEITMDTTTNQLYIRNPQ